jgi:carboxylate-amine ligase
MGAAVRLPDWAEWSRAGADAPWTVGLEEEVMLLDPITWMPASRSDAVLETVDAGAAGHTAAETHGAAVEIATDPHDTVAGAVGQLAQLRASLARGLERLGLVAAVSGTHPMARWEHTEVSPGARYQFLYASLRELARREPTFALHVHVAVPDPDSAVRALNGVRAKLPVLLAASANSPFWQGRDSGLASARTPIFQAFPRTGPPRHFAGYADYAEAIDVLLRCDAFPEPTFLWWDARLQPKLGTIEVRIMDAQTRVADTAALAALVQALVRHEALGGGGAPPVPPEVLEENRFLAARDGMGATFIDAASARCTRIADVLAELVRDCMPHAEWLGCAGELAAVGPLAHRPGALRQRELAAAPGGLPGMLRSLHREFLAAPASVHA